MGECDCVRVIVSKCKWMWAGVSDGPTAPRAATPQRGGATRPHMQGSELAAEFRQVWCQPRGPAGSIPIAARWPAIRIPPPHPQPQAAPGEPLPGTRSSAPLPVDRRPQAQAPGDLFPAPGATRPRLGNPEGPRTGEYGRPAPNLEVANLQGSISPLAQRRTRVTTSEQEPVFTARPPMPQVAGWLPGDQRSFPNERS